MNPGEPRRAHLSVAEALVRRSGAGEVDLVGMLEHRGVQISAFVPRRTEPARSHAADRIYVIMQGEGVFRERESRRSFQPGDLIFVAAETTHGFEEFSDGFATWVVEMDPRGAEGGD